MSISKLLLTGAFSTGKTTLAHELSKDGHLIELTKGPIAIRPDMARLCPLPLNREQGLLTSTWITGAMLQAEAEAEALNPKLLICDRGLPDVLSHTPASLMTTQAGLSLISATKSWCRTYSWIFWARPDPDQPVESDTLRVPDTDYREELDRALRDVFIQQGVSVIELPHKLQDRLEVVRKELTKSANP